jgi:ADP-heptose:LPS heptosyltransferase
MMNIKRPSRNSGAKDVAVFLQNKPYLGNQIALIPLFHYLREIYPQHDIVVCAHTRAAGVLQSMGYIDDLVPRYRPGKKMSFCAIYKALKPFRIDTVYTLRRHSIKTGLLARLNAQKTVVGFTARTTGFFLSRSVPFNANIYAAQNALALIDRQLSDFPSGSARNKKGDYFLIIPGGSLREQKYPLTRYIEIAEYLSAVRPVHFLLGADMADEIHQLSPGTGRFILHIGRPFCEVADIVKHSAVVIANDCGPAHFAHIYNVPRVLLAVVTDKAANWFYATNRSHLLAAPRNGNMLAIDKRNVLDAALRLFESR